MLRKIISRARARDEFRNQAKLLADRLGEEAPTYNLVYDVVSRLPADLVTLAHQGQKPTATLSI
jgi:hypothetical protein